MRLRMLRIAQTRAPKWIYQTPQVPCAFCGRSLPPGHHLLEPTNTWFCLTRADGPEDAIVHAIQREWVSLSHAITLTGSAGYAGMEHLWLFVPRCDGAWSRKCRWAEPNGVRVNAKYRANLLTETWTLKQKHASFYHEEPEEVARRWPVSWPDASPPPPDLGDIPAGAATPVPYEKRYF